jgi:glutaredoxin
MDNTTTITLYGVNWCPWVRRAREWLEFHKLPFHWVQVPDSQRERQEVLEVSGQTEVPVIVVSHMGKRHIFLEESHPELRSLLGV